MTKNQWKLLEILDRYGGEGTIEVEIQFGDYDFGDGEANESKGFFVTRLVVASLMRSLVKKGYATLDAGDQHGCGYDITDAGRLALQTHKAGVRHG